MAKKKRSVLSIVETVVVIVLIILIAGMLFLYFSFNEEGAAPDILGHTIYKTNAVNMEPIIHQGNAVIARKSAVDDIKTGDTVLAMVDGKVVVTRVEQLSSENGEMSYVIKYFTDPAENAIKVSRDSIIARGIWQSSILGSLIGFATSTVGIMLVIIIPSFMIIIFQIVRIISVRRSTEDAYSLDDIDDIMRRKEEEDNMSSDFSEPEPEENETNLLKPIQKTEPDRSSEILFDDPAPKNDSFGSKRNSVPLYSYNNDENDEKTNSEHDLNFRFTSDKKTEDTEPFMGQLSFSSQDKALGSDIYHSYPLRQSDERDLRFSDFSPKADEAPAVSEKPRTSVKPIPVSVKPRPVQPVSVPDVPAEDKADTVRSAPVRTAVRPTAKAAVSKPRSFDKGSDTDISELFRMIEDEESKL